MSNNKIRYDHLLVGKDSTIKEVMREIDLSGLSIACVVDSEKRLCGIVTDGDIRKALLEGKGLETPIFEIANTKPFTVGVGENVLERVKALLQSNESAIKIPPGGSIKVPVLDGHGRVVDIVFFTPDAKEWKVPLFKVYNGDDDIQAAEKVLKRNTYWTLGPEILEFERIIANYVKTTYALSFNSGTSASHAMLIAAGIGPGDEVIVPSFTFIATANAVKFVGATPVFADIEEETYALDPDSVLEKITHKTKAIMPMHYGGSVAKRIVDLAKLARDNGVLLFEDAAESLGAKLNEKFAGTFGIASALSFCGNKIITTGEGGAVITNDKAIYEKLKLVRSHGRLETQNYFDTSLPMDYVELGYNFRMPTIIAALGISQMNKMEGIIAKRREIANYFNGQLKNYVSVPFETENSRNVYQMYTIKLDTEAERDNLQRRLTDLGITTKIYFLPVHLSHYYGKVLGYTDKLEVTEDLAKRVLTLPIYPSMSKEDIDHVVNSVIDTMKH